MKRTLISAAIAGGFALVAGQAGAQAITSAQMAAVPAANTLFVSGATAPQQTIIDTIETNICGGTFTRLRTSSGNSARYQGWGCTRSGTPVAIYYTTLGSNWGVQPVLFGGGQSTPRVDASTCTTTAGVNRDNCSLTANVTGSVPDVGVSDISRTAFVGVNVPDTARLVLDFPELTSGGAPLPAFNNVFNAITQPYTSGGSSDLAQGVVFGIAVSNTLSGLLQGVQGLSVVPSVRDNRAPSVSKMVVSSILSGTLDASAIDSALGIDTTARTGQTRYVVCRRVPTSGTQAWANVYWLRNGTFPDSDLSAAPGADSTSWAGSKEVVYVANATGGQVRGCMNRANSSGLPAFGIISAENDNNVGVGTNTWSFAKLDGVAMEADSTLGTQAGNLSNVKSGRYDNVGEVVMNRRAALSGSNAALATKQGMYNTLLTNLRGSAVCTIGTPIATGAVQMAGVGSDTTCKTNWSRGGDPFNTPRRR